VSIEDLDSLDHSFFLSWFAKIQINASNWWRISDDEKFYNFSYDDTAACKNSKASIINLKSDWHWLLVNIVLDIDRLHDFEQNGSFVFSFPTKVMAHQS
jgi:hypothetical protein